MADWLDRGDNAWQMTAATIVGMQSMPGLVILYGGIVKKKWAVNSAFMALYAFAAVLVCWVTWAYKMSFGEELLPLWGKAGPVLSQSYLLGQAIIPAASKPLPNKPDFIPLLPPAFPAATLVYFQFVFAAITVIILAGSLLGRMSFKAWMLFVPLWLTFSYSVSAFSLWGGGFLFRWGILDFAGGYVIHVSSGVAGYVAAFWVGPRLKKDRDHFPPNNILMTLAGAGLLWLGWSGFNGGSALAASGSASVAVLNTHVCTATSLLVWTSLDMIFFGKPSVIGAVQGMTTGLVCITPAAGLVQGWAAIVMGVLSGSVPWLSMMVLHKRYKALQYVDDTLGVVHTHALAGVLGGLLTGLLAEPTLTGLFAPIKGARGSFYGGKGADQVGRQLVGALFVIGWNVAVTSLICWLISLLTPLRMSEEELALGDDAAHGEAAYALWAGDERLDPALLPFANATGLNPHLHGLHYASAGASPAPSVNPTVHDHKTFAA